MSRLPQFASRRRTAKVDGAPVAGFFANDFTLADIKQLRAVQHLLKNDPSYGRCLVDGRCAERAGD